MPIWAWAVIFAVAVVCGIIGFILGQAHRKNVAEKAIGSAQEEANRIVAKAVQEGEQKKKESIVEAKEEIHQMRDEMEKEMKERRAEISKQERRLNQKEENLDRKTDNLEKKDDNLNRKLKDADKKIQEAEALKQTQQNMLEKISSMTVQQAKDYLLSIVENQLDHEKAVKILDYENRLKDECDEKAKEIISTAIQRCAADQTAETTVSVVDLPNDDMKGRIIGREGRNIKAIENVTGADLIIDDTPESITVSCFDPVRREIARITLEKLIADGRIHPAKIEEMFQKATKEVNNVIRQTGEKACIEAGVNNLNPELVKMIGRLKYRTSYGQSVLKHSLEVSYLVGLMAAEIGADEKLARRAGLLHDIGKSIDHDVGGSHVELGVEYAKRYRENDIVVNAIAAHHGDVEPKSVIACLVQAADAISASRPGARREDLESYIKRLEKLEEIAKSFDGVDKCYAIQAGREVRILVKPEIISDDKMVIIARDIAKKIEEEMEYPGQIKVNIIRETRAADYAK